MDSAGIIVRRWVMLLLIILPLVRAGAQKAVGGEESGIYSPGCVVPENVIGTVGAGAFFSNQAVPDTIFALMQGRSYKEDCTVPRTDLRYLLILHRNLEGQAVVGELVVNRQIASDVLQIMQQLFRESYPIERVRLIDYYDADDERSMMANNTSCFCWRTVSGSTTVSRHALGMAVDINPLYNPYHRVRNGREVVQPASGRPYLDRKAEFPYKITEGDVCYRLFIAHGFKWGGAWTSLKDYQHFEK